MADPTPRTQAPAGTTRAEGDLSPAWPAGQPRATTAAGTTDAAGRPVSAAPVADPAAATTPDRMRVYSGTSPMLRMSRMVWLLWMIAELIVALRVIFKAVAANPDAGFVSFIYGISGPLTAPFRPIMGDRVIGTHGVLEASSLIAMVIFFAGALILASFLRILAAPRVRAVA